MPTWAPAGIFAGGASPKKAPLKTKKPPPQKKVFWACPPPSYKKISAGAMQLCSGKFLLWNAIMALWSHTVISHCSVSAF